MGFWDRFRKKKESRIRHVLKDLDLDGLLREIEEMELGDDEDGEDEEEEEDEFWEPEEYLEARRFIDEAMILTRHKLAKKRGEPQYIK